MSKRGETNRIRRQSPFDLGLKPDSIVENKGWEIVQTYQGEEYSNSLFITDLSHVPQWTLQSRHFNSVLPKDMDVPVRPGEASLEKGVLVCRLSHDECRIMDFGAKDVSFEDPHYTDMTDAFATVALVGRQCIEVLSRLSPVDLDGPNRSPLSAARAPLEDITCLLLSIRRDGVEPGLIVSTPRGYGSFLVEIFQDAGEEFGLAPAGWKRFHGWLQGRA